MKSLTMMMFLATLVTGMGAGNIPDIERNPVVDFVSFLASVKNNIINFLTAGFTTQNNDSHHHAALPPSSSHLHHHRPPSPPHASHNPGQLFPHQPLHKTPYIYHPTSPDLDNSNLEAVPIIDIDIPAQVQHVEKPGENEKKKIINQVTASPVDSENTTVVTSEDTKTDSEHIDISKTVELKSDSAESFVDNNNKVNAGIELTTHTDKKTVKNIPEDLWREDFVGIKSKSTHKLGKKIRKVKRLKTIQETT